MNKKKSLAIALAILLISVLACSLPGPAAEDGANPNPPAPVDAGAASPLPATANSSGATQADPAAATAALQTQIAALVAGTATAQAALDQAVAQTMAAMPTNTLQATWTPVFTDTASVVMVTVSANTNCRTGPGEPYDLIGILVKGKPAEVVGRAADGGSWIIRWPDNPSRTCWLWSQYASVTGNGQALPVVIPPPTPTPSGSFKVVYYSTETCKGQWAFKVKITNNGSTTWESNRFNATDTSTGKNVNVDRDYFIRYDGCSLVELPSKLNPGEVGFMTSEAFNKSPYGHTISATIRLCSKDGLSGICVEKTISFTP